MKSIVEWIKAFESGNKPTQSGSFATGRSVFSYLREIYGNRPDFISAQIDRYARVLKEFHKRYNAQGEIVIVRAPGRVNLIGMHIDHRGGAVNPIASNEIILVAQKRNDDIVNLHNSDSFPYRCFRISHEMSSQKILNWEKWTQNQSEAIKRRGLAGDWANYIKGSLVYLQEQYRNGSGGFSKRLHGMDVLVDGDIPMASGLASSSALVIAAAEAAIAINELPMMPEDLVDLCGTAEWYVGTRGGKGDHAAIKMSRQGDISNIGFLPLTVDYAPFPSDYRIVVCSSFVQAKKSAGAKSIFNERVASYEIGMMLLKQRCPELMNGIKYIRDVTPEKLGVSEAEIYELLKMLPLRITRAQLALELPGQADKLSELYRTHDELPDGYRVRGVCLFGIAECERSRLAVKLLRQGNLEEFGELISLSHDGDRVKCKKAFNSRRVITDISNTALDRLRDKSASNNPAMRESSRIYRQPGGYAVSCEELDTLVDIALEAEGVLGAGRIGAGLGGCISVLVKASCVDALIDALNSGYYAPRELPLGIEVCFPVEGAGQILARESFLR
jgi:N-acetylgalactosamine kinase